MAEARRLDSGLWRIYLKGENRRARHKRSGTIATFYSLAEARRWWQKMHPEEPPLQEAARCAGCGAYISPGERVVTYAGRIYHGTHTSFAIAPERGIAR
jgi:hypothetical protein